MAEKLETLKSRARIMAVMVPILIVVGSAPARAETNGQQDANLSRQVYELKAMVEAQNTKIEQQQIELRQLRRQQDPLHERRAEDIKALVEEVLADAESRASFLDGLTAGHDGSNFFIGSSDGGFMMKIFGLFQARWVGTFRGDESGRSSVSPDDNSETGFEFRRIELGFKGHVGDPRIGYVLVLATEDGAAGVEQIIAQDVVLSYKLTDDVTLMGGRYFAPFLREELIGGGGSLAVALSYMNNELSIGRGEGITLLYEKESFRGQVFLSDGAGSGGGGGVNSPHADGVDWAVTGRGDIKVSGDWSQWGDFTGSTSEPMAVFIGGAVHFQHGETGDSVAANDVDLFAWTVDGSVEDGGFNIFFAVAGEHFDANGTADMDNYGVVVQAGYMAIPISLNRSLATRW